MLQKLDLSSLPTGEIEGVGVNKLVQSQNTSSDDAFSRYMNEHSQSKTKTKTENTQPSTNKVDEESVLKERNVSDGEKSISEPKVTQKSTKGDTELRVAKILPNAKEGESTSLADSEAETDFYHLMIGMKDIKLEGQQQDRLKLDSRPHSDVNSVNADDLSSDIINRLHPQSGNDNDITDLDHLAAATNLEGVLTSLDRISSSNAKTATADDISEADLGIAEELEREFLLSDGQNVAHPQNVVGQIKPAVATDAKITSDNVVISINNEDDAGIVGEDIRLSEINRVVEQWNQVYREAEPSDKAQLVSQMKQFMSATTGLGEQANSQNDSGKLFVWGEADGDLSLSVMKEQMTQLVNASTKPEGEITISIALTQMARDIETMTRPFASDISRELGLESMAKLSTDIHSSDAASHKVDAKNTVDKTLTSLNLMRTDATKKLAEKVSVMINQRHLLADIRLDPADLGMMQIRINMQGDQAQVNFVVQSPQTQQLLEQHTQRLREILQSQGVELGETQVSHDEQAFAQQQGNDEQTEHGNNGSINEEASDGDELLAQEITIDDGRIDDFA